MFLRCPKCGHQPLPPDQALPAACPACGVILAKMEPAALAEMARRSRAGGRSVGPADRHEASAGQRLTARLLQVPGRRASLQLGLRLVLWLGFGVWGLHLIGLDHRSGDIGGSFIHGPLLVFHEAGHVIFRPFGHFVMVLGGTLGQLLMPAVIGVAFLWKNRDPFGAAIGLWLFGVSLLDVAPYMFDALQPQLMLLSGNTGEAGGHDWIEIFRTLGLLSRAQTIGSATHAIGAVTVLLALGWAGWLLVLHAAGAGDRDQEAGH